MKGEGEERQTKEEELEGGREGEREGGKEGERGRGREGEYLSIQFRIICTAIFLEFHW